MVEICVSIWYTFLKLWNFKKQCKYLEKWINKNSEYTKKLFCISTFDLKVVKVFFNKLLYSLIASS